MADHARKTGAAYEQSDATLRPLLLFFGGLALFCAVIFVAMVVFFDVLQSSFTAAERAQAPAPPPLAAIRQVPPEPRLQYAEPVDLVKFRAEEARRLHSYGWVDRAQGVVRIPVPRALELLRDRGLPTRPSTAPRNNGGTP